MDYRQLDTESFNLKPCEIAGDDCVLITPKEIGVTWTKETLCFRSIIIRKSDGWVINRGMDKFFNAGEKPDLYPEPQDHNDWEIREKIDGSLIIISKYEQTPIVRTRGVVDAFQHDSGPELMTLLDENPRIINNDLVNTEEYSLLLEHCSRVQQIVIRHDKPKLVLIGAIHNQTGKMLGPDLLDGWAETLGLERPKKFKFNSIYEIIENCRVLKGAEGYVLSFSNYDFRVKLKGAEYLFLHKAKSQISSWDKVLDLFLASNTDDFPSFYSYVETHLDHELAEIAKTDMEEICRLNLLAHRELDKMREKIVELSQKTRKDAAVEIQKLYDESERGLAFSMLNGKEISVKQHKELILRIREEKQNHHQDLYETLLDMETHYGN